jgi:hypothetical protein
MKARNIPLWISVAATGLLLFGFGSLPRNWADTVTPADKAAYLAALRDAAVSEQWEISRNLVAVVPSWDEINNVRLKGDSLVWEGDPGKSRVLVAAFMSRDSYVKYYKANLEAGSPEYVLSKSLWVTVAPELQNYFWSDIHGLNRFLIPTAKRVKQLLGLHPAYDYEVIVEMFADPADLFRPSADPEITDHEAESALPPGASSNAFLLNGGSEWIFPRDQNPFLALRADAYFKDSKWSPAQTFKEWFSDRADTIYSVGDESDPATWGWPWTRLGYTYDWGNSVDHHGLSEFVLRVDPNRNGGEAVVRLVRAVDSASVDWVLYFARLI